MSLSCSRSESNRKQYMIFLASIYVNRSYLCNALVCVRECSSLAPGVRMLFCVCGTTLNLVVSYVSNIVYFIY